MSAQNLASNPPSVMTRRAAVQLFLIFAFAYFLSALLRAVTATLAPVFSQELGLTAGDLGLLAGAYFLGFAAMQLPLGQALDRHGPRRVLLGLLAMAVVGCAAFAMARTFTQLFVARMLIGVGVAACLMAPMTSYRLRFSPQAQLSATSWMLMTGSLGMLASTLPVQWLLPLTGWRGLFALVTGLLMSAWLFIALAVKPDVPPRHSAAAHTGGYGAIVRRPVFMRLAPMGFFNYGGMVAVQSLWAGPWLTQVCGWTPPQAASGLFVINLCMLVVFFGWGLVTPRLTARGIGPEAIMRWGMPASLAVMAVNLALGAQATAGLWALWCVCSTAVAVSQPHVGQAYDKAVAGRALSAFNLVIFAGVFCVQWGIGLGIDALQAAGLARDAAFQLSFAAYGLCNVAAYLWFLRGEGRRAVDNRPEGASA